MMEAWFSSSDRTASCGVSKAWEKAAGVELLPNHLGVLPPHVYRSQSFSAIQGIPPGREARSPCLPLSGFSGLQAWAGSGPSSWESR